jgi:hypothetical protein
LTIDIPITRLGLIIEHEDLSLLSFYMIEQMFHFIDFPNPIQRLKQELTRFHKDATIQLYNMQLYKLLIECLLVFV